SRERKSAPRIGTSLAPGMPAMSWADLSCSKPAIIIAPPDGSSTVVSARRTVSAGTTSTGPPEPVDTLKAPWLFSSDTSVESFSEIRPPDSTTGVKPRPMPKSLNSTDTDPVFDSDTGTGNWPPTRNFAASPETAVRFGSASVRTRPTCSKASTLPVPWFSPVEPAVDCTVEMVPWPPLVQVWQTIGRPLSNGLELTILEIGWVVVLIVGPNCSRPPRIAPFTPKVAAVPSRNCGEPAWPMTAFQLTPSCLIT